MSLKGLYYSLCWKLKNLKWFIFHRIHPHHRYHVVRTGLAPGYADECEVILHVSFTILKTFYERQIGPHNSVNWQEEENHSRAFSEMTDLYTWWTQTRPNRESTLPPFPCHGEKVPIHVFMNDEEWCRIAHIHNEAEAQWDKEDDAMLHRLVDIRLWMWD